MAFLKTILILLLIYYGLKSIIRYFGPSIIRYITKKAGEKFQRHFDIHQNSPQNPVDGDITIDKKTKNKTSNNSGGEYIDFEEID